MEITLWPPLIYLIGCIIVYLLILLGLFTKWNYSKSQRFVSIIVVTAIFLIFSFISIQKTAIDIGESGLQLSGNLNIFIPWDEIKSVNYQKNYKGTGYKPEHKKAGIDLPGHTAGNFQLANKKRANCVVYDFSEDAIILDTKKGFYLLSFDNLAEAYKEISRHTVEKNSNNVP